MNFLSENVMKENQHGSFLPNATGSNFVIDPVIFTRPKFKICDKTAVNLFWRDVGSDHHTEQ